MDKKVKFEVVRPLIDEAFSKGDSFTFKPNGVSMYPFIKGGRTFVTIEKYKGGAKKYDIVFYQRDDGKYVMHRIIKAQNTIQNDFYGVCGDNQWWVENVTDGQIFARVTHVEGKKGMGGFLYLRTLFMRRFIKHVFNYVKRHIGGNKK